MDTSDSLQSKSLDVINTDPPSSAKKSNGKRLKTNKNNVKSKKRSIETEINSTSSNVISTDSCLQEATSSKSKKRKQPTVGEAAPVRKRRRTQSIDETTKEPSVRPKAKLYKVESNRFLKKNPAVTRYQVDPFFEDNLPVPFISSSVQSKLAIRAVILNDTTLLQSLIDDVDHVCSIHIKRDFPESLSAIHYAIQHNHIDLLRILFNDFKNPKENRCHFPQVIMNIAGFQPDETMTDSRARECNNALLKDITDIVCSDTQEEILVYAMEHNCSREIYDLISEDLKSKGFKNVFTCTDAGHRKLAASIINDRQYRNYYGFSELHYQVLSFDDEDLFVDSVSKVTKKAQENFQLTPIHCAAINPNAKYLKQLLAIVPKYDIMDKYRRQPIHFAAVCEGSEPLEYLLSKDVNFNDVDKDGNSPLHLAVKNGRAKNAEVLLRLAKEKAESNEIDDQTIYEKFGLASINRMNKLRHSPLHLAVLNNHLDCVKILVEYGAQIDMFTSISTDKLTPLMLACQHGFLNIVVYLIDHGARVEARDRYKRTPLIHACMYGQAHIVSYLLRLGANANVFDSSLNTALHYATAYGWYFCVKLLVEAGANLNSTNFNQMTCLGVAFSKGHYGIWVYLIEECHADINIKTWQGLTLVMIIVNLKISSTTVGQLEQVVRKYKADCTLTDNNGRNALHYLALNHFDEGNQDNYLHMAKLLVDYQCNPIQMDNKAQTPFINALQRKNYILVDFFLNHAKIEWNSDICYDGKTLLHYFAIDCDNYQLTQMLINQPVTNELKLMAQIRDSDGRTPFHYCIKQFDEFCQKNHSSNKQQYQSITNMIRYFLEELECDPDVEIKSKDESSQEQANIFYLLRTVSSSNQIDEHPLVIFLKKTKNINILHYQTQRTALLEAIHLKEMKIIDILLNQSSCDINLATPELKQTPLILACKLQYFSLIRHLLLNPKCDPFIYDEEHNQALHYYLSTSQRSDEYIEIFHLFIEKIKSININSLNNQDKLNRTPLHIAVHYNLGTFNSTNIIEQTLINNQCDLFSQDNLGNLPLHNIFLTKKIGDDPIQLCSLIIQAMKYNLLDSKNHEGNTPLYLAVSKASTICVMLLLRHGANLLIENNLSNSALSICIASNHLNLFINFLQQPIDMDLNKFYIESSKEMKETCSTGKETEKFWVWKYSMKPNCQIVRQYSLIYFIIQHNWEGILALIFNELNRFHLKYIDIITAAILNNRFKLVLHLLLTIPNQTILNETNSDGQNLLHLLAQIEQSNKEFSEKIFNYLSNQEIEWNIPDKYGSYPLHYACIQQNKFFIEFLHNKYSNELNFNQIDSFNNTAYGLLFCSLARKTAFDKEFLRTLITSSKSLDCLCYYDNNEMTRNPLSFGYSNSTSEYVISYPPEKSEGNTLTTTHIRISPLINAIIYDNIELVKFLLKLGVDRNFPDEEQRTPLMYAVRQNNIDIVKLLLNQTDVSAINNQSSQEVFHDGTIDVNAVDVHGRTCIHYLVQPFPDASYTTNIELLELLHRENALLTIVDQTGLSPLEYSINNGCQHLYEKLLELINEERIDSIQSIIKPFSINDPNKYLLTSPDYYSDAQKFIDEYILTHLSENLPTTFPVDPLTYMDQTGEVLIDTDKNEPYDVRLTITDVDCGPIGLYNFYRMQIIKHKSKTKLYLLFTRWGRIGKGDGEHKLTPYSSFDQCRTEFCKIFYEKTGNLWENTNQFETKPKQYTLIQLNERHVQKQISVPIDFQQLQDENQHLPSKLQSSVYQDFFRTFLNPKSIQTNLQKCQLDIEWMPVSQLKPSILQKAYEILIQLKQHIQEKDKVQLQIQQTTDDSQKDQYKDLLDSICKLTNEYYSMIPLKGYASEKLPMIDSEITVKAQEQKLDDILELELSYKMLLAAQANLNQISPLDYLYKSMNCQFEAMNRNDLDSQFILRYIWTSEPKIKVEQIFKIARLNSNERLFRRNLPNQYLLWHGTDVCNLISILTRGLLVAPLCATFTGAAFGKGIYTSDVFTKGLQYCTGLKQSDHERCFMLLCQVALGNMQEDDSKEALDLSKYQSRKVCGYKRPDSRYTITRNYGVQMPLGQLIDYKGSKYIYHRRTHNEYIVFDESQVTIRYLVQFRR